MLLSRSKNEFNDNINFIKNNYSNSEILIEEMIEGDQISSEHIIYEGQVFTFGLALRNYEDSKNFYPHIIENGGIQCHPKVLKILEDIEKCVNTISNKLNINNSILKFDLIIKKDKIYILEMATRMSGGDFASSIIPLSIGTDYITIAIESLIKQKDFIDILKQKSIKKEKKYLLVSNRYLMPEKEGVFSDIIWPKENYLKIEEFLMKKEKYKKPTHHGERMAVFVLSDYILSNLEKRIKNVYRSLIINYENNWRNK